MFALIQKTDNQILRTSTDNVFLVESKPFYWKDCPDDVNINWTFDGENFIEPDPVIPSLESQAESVRNALQSAIDVKARSFGFSGGNALMLYAGFVNPFQPLAQVFATWEASVWVEADAYKVDVIAGIKPMLSPSEAVALMPAYPV